MRKGKKFLLVALIIMAITAIFTLAACKSCGDKPSKGAYYLSVYENAAWTGYESDDDVPATHKFVQNSENEDVYNLKISLEKGALVRIAKVGSDETYGGAELFSALTALTAGTDNAISVAEAGTFEFSLVVSEKSIEYKFTAKEKPEEKPPVTEAKVLLVEIAEASFTLTYPETKQLTATVTFDDNTTSTENIEWESSAKGVATVSGGLVTSVSAGTAQITAKAGGVESDPITVTVNGTVTLDKTSATLKVGGTTTITATAAGGATISDWLSSDTDVATVADGVVTAVAPGTADIKVNYVERPGAAPKTLTCEITVTVPVTGISLSSSTLNVNAEASKTLEVVFAPANASNKNYTVEYEDGKEFIEVTEDGLTLTVKGLQVTTTPVTLTVKSEDGDHTATCDVTVVEAGAVIVSLTSDGADVTNLNLHTTTSHTADLSVEVSNGTVESVTWSSSATGVATVEKNTADDTLATVTSVWFGTATVTATVKLVDVAQTVPVTCTVLVAPDNFYLYGENFNVNEGDDFNWGASIDAVSPNMRFAKDGAVYTLDYDLVAGQDFRLAHTDSGFASNYENYTGLGWKYCTGTIDNMEIGSSCGTQSFGWDNGIKVSVSGNYTLTVDLSGTAPVISIELNYLTVSAIEIGVKEGSLTLEIGSANKNSVTLEMSATPANAEYDPDDIKWTLVCTGVSENDLTVVKNGTLITITLKSTATVGTITVKCELNGKTAESSLAVAEEIIAAETVEFDSNEFFVDVANGWSGTLSAKVLGAGGKLATNQSVTYTCSDASVSFNGNTVTGTKLGTFTITAASAENNSVTTSIPATVTFYSSKMYLYGVDSNWDTTNDPTAEGDSHKNYVFTEVAGSNKKQFVLNVTFTASQRVQICFPNFVWNESELNHTTATKATGSVATGAKEMEVSGGSYTIIVDLSGYPATVKFAYIASATLKGGDADVTKNASLSNGKYSISVSANLVPDTDYTIEVADAFSTLVTIADTTNFTGDTENLTAGDGAFRCTAEGSYKFEILCDTDGSNYTVTVTYTAPTDEVTWTSDSTYSVSKWSNSKGSLGTVNGYSGSNGQYKLCFSYTTGASDEIGFAVVIGGTWNNLVPNKVTSGGTFDNRSANVGGDSSWSNFWADNAGNTIHFEAIFTVSGNNITLLSLKVADTSFVS